ncbi:MAG: hypothetical protein NC400_15355 [Clostridium sp.]|nr:hypothetical protein [Clostridium sp.]
MIPPLRKAFSDEKKRQSKPYPPKPLTDKFFSEVLDETCEKAEQANLRICTSGYTRNALPYHVFINMREYC